MTNPLTRCPRPLCNRAGDDIGTCVDSQTIVGCANPVPVDPIKDLVVRCRPCNRTFAFTVDEAVRGRLGRGMCQGERDVCAAVILPQKTK